MAKKKAVMDYDEALGHLTEAMPDGGLDVDGVENCRPFPPCGLYLPTFAERYLFGTNVMMFGRTYVFYGVERTCKSAFLADRYRLFWHNGGRYAHIETEDKDASDLRTALLGYPDNYRDSDWVRRGDSMGEWQRSFHAYLDWFKAHSEKFGGRRFPLAMGVDSLMAKMTTETVDRVDENSGEVTKAFGVEANSLRVWFPQVLAKIQGWPFVIMGVNHDKPVPDPKNAKVTIHRSPGGFGPRFFASCRILFVPGSDIKRDAEGVEGQTVWLKADKNSSGKTGNKIQISLKWKYDLPGPDGKARQRIWWDWDGCTTETLHYVAENAVGDLKARVKDEIGLRRHPGKLWSCAAVGVSEDDALPTDQMGAAINASPDVSRLLDDIFEVKQHPVFQKGADLRTQLGVPL